uniref:Uncharacterized protein n=1 Tax=Timema tahoe TaxID=61484 RepID=A0A7R9IJF9_9NEOP|nr:unnamed protein product [Timema tahoe]
MDGCVVYHQVSREESRPSAAAVASSSSPPAPSTTNTSRRLLEEVLQRPAPYPMIVLPPGGGYWLDGQDHDCPFDPRGQPILPHNAWRSKIETDDTAKCYRRFFVGRVSCPMPLSPQLAHKLSPSDTVMKEPELGVEPESPGPVVCPLPLGHRMCPIQRMLSLAHRYSIHGRRKEASDGSRISTFKDNFKDNKCWVPVTWDGGL